MAATVGVGRIVIAFAHPPWSFATNKNVTAAAVRVYNYGAGHVGR